MQSLKQLKEVSILNPLISDKTTNSSYEQTFDSVYQQGFDYENLDLQTQINIKQKTFEIKSLIRKTAQDIVEMGQKLAEVKQQLKHGKFISWLKFEFNWSVSSATKFMQVSEQFKNVNFTYFNFDSSALYILAAPSTPESARLDAMKIASEGKNITYSLAKSIVKQHKALAQTNSHCSSKVNSGITEQLNPEVTLPLINIPQENIVKETDRNIRIVEIKQEQTYLEDKMQYFEIIYARTSILVKGEPQYLTDLFKKMQNCPQFTKDILTAQNIERELKIEES